MLQTYALSAYRALRRDGFYAALSGAGLALALACCVLIGLFLRAELSYDRFHNEADRIVIVAMEQEFGGERRKFSSTAYPLREAIAAEAPAATRSVLTTQSTAPHVVVGDAGESLGEAGVLAASEAFFELFSFGLLAGDASGVLAQPDAVVITTALAERLFGEGPALGRAVRFRAGGEVQERTVRGVVEAPPRTSTVQFDAVVPVQAAGTSELGGSAIATDSWDTAEWKTYAQLAPGATVEAFDEQLGRIAEAHLGGSGGDRELYALPLPDFYLSDVRYSDGFRGDVNYLRLFGAAALLTLVLGAINYVNLATARAT